MNPFSSSHSYHHPGSDLDDEPPAYNADSTFMSEHESPTAASRQGATMRLLPTTGNVDGDMHGESDLGENPFGQGYAYSDAASYVLIFS